MSQIPKMNFVFYKNLLDICFSKFFQDFNDDFAKQDDKFIYASRASKTKLKNIFRKYLVEVLKPFIKPYSLLNKDIYFILGSCLPKDNILLKFKSDKYFPAKLAKILNQDVSLRYYLREKDIQLDMVQFNQVFEEVFDEFFKSPSKILKAFGKEFPNLIFIQHKTLDCLTLYNTCKWIFGRSNVVNMYEQFYDKERQNIFSMNEMIDKYIHEKKQLNSSYEFVTIAQEIRQFIDEKLQNINNGKEQTQNICC